MAQVTSNPSSLRALDKLYLAFFAGVIPFMVILDLQPLYPPQLIPHSWKAFHTWFVTTTADPLIGRRLGGEPQMAWFDACTWIEGVFYVPAMCLAVYGLLKRHQSVYVLLLAFSSSIATTLLPCLFTVLSVTTSSIVSPPLTTKLPDSAGKVLPLTMTETQKLLLVSIYTPFLTMCVVMAVDSALNLWRMVGSYDPEEVKRKAKALGKKVA